MTLGMPTVTVVVPAFNASSTIERALSSVASQSFAPCETIVVDDGSTDATSVLAQNAGATVIRTLGNTGPSAARNLGCKHSSGDLVAFLDADDVWYPAKLAAQVYAMQENSDCALCYTRFVRFPSDEQPPADADAVARAEKRRVQDVLRNPYLGTPTVVVKASVFRELGGFNTAFRYGEDVDLWMRVAARYPILHIPSVLCAVATSPLSLTAAGGVRVDQGNLAVLEQFEHSHPEISRQYRSDLRYIRATIRTRMASTQLGRRDRRAAWSELREALRANPTHGRALYLLLRSLLPLR